MNKPEPVEYSLRGRRESAAEALDKNLDISNQTWHEVLRLIITLAASGLVLTVALARDIFPILGSTGRPLWFLIISWILFFISIILGIVAWLKESLFFTKQAYANEKVIKECDEKLAQGKVIDTVSNAERQEPIVTSTILWGVASIDSFILAIIFICVAFLDRVIPNASWYILIISLIIVFGLNLHLLNERCKIIHRPVK